MTSKLNGQTVATLRYYWDDQAGATAGWYVEARDAQGEFLDDSVKTWFPLDVDQFGKSQEAELVAALTAEFPGAETVHA